jgi:hypothetical protein
VRRLGRNHTPKRRPATPNTTNLWTAFADAVDCKPHSEPTGGPDHVHGSSHTIWIGWTQSDLGFTHIDQRKVIPITRDDGIGESTILNLGADLTVCADR